MVWVDYGGGEWSLEAGKYVIASLTDNGYFTACYLNQAGSESIKAESLDDAKSIVISRIHTLMAQWITHLAICKVGQQTTQQSEQTAD